MRIPFKTWFADRAAEAKLTASEIAELTAWLIRRRQPTFVDEARVKRSPKPEAKITAKDVQEFFGWLGSRMDEAKLNDSEKRQLNDWVSGRIETNPEVQKPEAKLHPQDVQEFLSWFSLRMDDANLDDVEKRQLNDWVSQRIQTDPDVYRKSAPKLAPQDGPEFLKWFWSRMDDAMLDEAERRLLSDWVFDRIQTDPEFQSALADTEHREKR